MEEKKNEEEKKKESKYSEKILIIMLQENVLKPSQYNNAACSCGDRLGCIYFFFFPSH